MKQIDQKQNIADFMSQVAILRADPSGIETELSLAIGILLSNGFSGCAAAVAVLAQTHTQIDLDYYIGPKP